MKSYLITLLAPALILVSGRIPNLAQSAVSSAVPLVVPSAGVSTGVSTASDLPEISAKSPIADEEIRARFRTGLEGLQKAKLTTSGEELNEQLKGRAECTLSLPPERTEQLTTESLFRNCRPSTLIVGNIYKCGKCSRWHESMASGFAIAPDVVATNYHVMENDKAATFAVMTAAGDLYPVIEVLAGNEEDDAAIVRVSIPEGKPALTPVPIAAHTRIGGRVAVISHPAGQFYTFTEGMVSRYAAFQSADDGPTSVRMTITADYARGSSGAPVFDSCGNVCGMVSSTKSIYYDKGNKDSKGNLQMVVNSCVPAASISNLITAPKE